ncbi:hypothetical protein AKJ16_DCAP05443 [Drosera capensis]
MTEYRENIVSFICSMSFPHFTLSMKRGMDMLVSIVIDNIVFQHQYRKNVASLTKPIGDHQNADVTKCVVTEL